MARTTDKNTRLLELFEDGAELTTKEIQARLAIGSDRHVRRILKTLRAEDKRITYRKDGRLRRYLIPIEQRKQSMPLLSLTEKGMFALAVAAKASRSMLAPTPLAEPLREAFDALLRGMAGRVFSFEAEDEGDHWHFSAAPAVPIDPDIFWGLSTAIKECRRVEIDYQSASSGRFTSRRPVEPYGLAMRSGSWLLVAYCLKSRGMRDFSLVGISRLYDVPDTYFTRDERFDLNEYFRSRFNALSGDLHEVRLLVEPDRAVYFHRKRYHPTQQIEETHDDGRIVVRYSVAGLEDIRTFAQGWGVGVTVLSPPELVETMRTQARELAERYERRTPDQR